MVLSLATLAVTLLPAALPADLPSFAQDPEPLLGKSDHTRLNKKAVKWFDAFKSYKEAELKGDSRKQEKFLRDEQKARDAFMKDWDKSQSKGNLLASVPDLRAIWANAFTYDRPKPSPSGGVRTVKGAEVPHATVVPKRYKPDNPYPTVLLVPGYREGRGWTEPTEYFASTWEGVESNAGRMFVIPLLDKNTSLSRRPGFDEGLTPAEMSSLQGVLGAAGEFQQSYHVDRGAFFLDCGKDACGFGLRLATYFPSRFAGVILRHPEFDDTLRLDGLREQPVLLVKSADTAQACDELSKALTEVGAQVKVVDGAGAYPFKDSAAEVAAWSDEQRRVPCPTRAIVAPTIDGFRNAYWVRMGTAEPLGGLPMEEHPILDVTADRETNRIEVKAVNVANFTLLLNDSLVDLDKEFTIVVNGQAITEKRSRSMNKMIEEMKRKFDPEHIFPASVDVVVPPKDE